MPLNDQLLQIKRISETDYETKSLLPVSFATLIVPEKITMSELCMLLILIFMFPFYFFGSIFNFSMV